MAVSFITQARSLFSDPDIAIDLGTANTRMYARGRGLIADEPSVIKVRPDTGCVEAVGLSAAQAKVLNPKMPLISPLRAGVIADINSAAALLTPLLRRAHSVGLRRPRVLACAPTDAQENERQALVEATRKAGASAVVLAPEPLAAAIGIGMDVSSSYAQLLVDIGDGVTDIAVIRSGELIKTAALRIACSDLTAALCQMIKEEQGIELYGREAIEVIRKVGAKPSQRNQNTYFPAGTDCRTGTLRRSRVSSDEVYRAIAPGLSEIVEFIGQSVRTLPPELSCEVIESGLHLTGGGMCIPGIAERIALETGLSVSRAHDPLHAVIKGARKMLTTSAQTNWWQHANSNQFLAAVRS
ncbi:MAG TPA: rod shape-determining protein [Blastocatellia bacterium]|nr:rod shape-determining protein [Blastocatellia bacterium]